MLAFTRDGRFVVLRDGDDGHSVTLVQIEGGAAEHRIEAPGLRAVAGFDDEVWLVAGDPPALRRVDLEGRALGEPLPLPAGGRLVAAPFGDPSALWLGPEPVAIELVRGALSAAPIESGAQAIPIAPGRRLELREGAFVLCQPEGEQALTAAGDPGGARLIDGAAILEERAVAMVLDRGGARQLVVIGARDGAVQHRMPLGDVRRAAFAHRRGHAVLLEGERRLTIVDLRFGRNLKTWEEPGAVGDFAVDSGARTLMVQRPGAGGAIETFHGSYREILGALPPLASARSAPTNDSTATVPDHVGAGATRDPSTPRAAAPTGTARTDAGPRASVTPRTPSPAARPDDAGGPRLVAPVLAAERAAAEAARVSRGVPGGPRIKRPASVGVDDGDVAARDPSTPSTIHGPRSDEKGNRDRPGAAPSAWAPPSRPGFHPTEPTSERSASPRLVDAAPAPDPSAGDDASAAPVGERIARDPAAIPLEALVLDERTAEGVRLILAWAHAEPDAALRGPGAIVVFDGPPGTGKSSTAAAIAGALGWPLLRRGGAALFAGDADAVRARLAALSAARAGAPTVLAIADALPSETPADRGALAELERFLDGANGLVVLERSAPPQPPIAHPLLRRAVARVPFPLPSAALRERLIARLAEADLELPLDAPAELARFPLAGGAIRRALEHARLLAAADGEAPTVERLRDAFAYAAATPLE